MFTIRPAFSFWHRGDAALLRSPHFERNGPENPYAYGLGPMVLFEEQDVLRRTAPIADSFDDVETLVWAIPDNPRDETRELDRIVGPPPDGFALPFEATHRRIVIQLTPNVERPTPETQRAIVSTEVLEDGLTPLAGRAPGSLVPVLGSTVLYAARLGRGEVVEVPVGRGRGAYLFVVNGCIEVGQPRSAVEISSSGDAVTIRGPKDAWLEGVTFQSEVLVVCLPLHVVRELRLTH